jgi:hypothetical protein
MPTFIPARGRTLHLAGVCVNRIGTEDSYAVTFAARLSRPLNQAYPLSRRTPRQYPPKSGDVRFRIAKPARRKV